MKARVAAYAVGGGLVLMTTLASQACSSAPSIAPSASGSSTQTNVSPAPDDAGNPFGLDGDVRDGALVDECRRMDVVFVVDDSGSMAPKQAKLTQSFPKLVDALDRFRAKSGASLDYRLAVTSTDTLRTNYATGGRGGFVTKSPGACSVGPDRAWLERTDGDVAAAFACRAGLGTSGSQDEHPLDALTLAIGDRLRDQNKGFLRDDALLAFFLLTDEEDTSVTSPAEVVRMLDQSKKLRGRWAGAVLSGPETTSCGGGSFGGGDASPRLHELVKLSADATTGHDNVIWRSICQDSFETAVTDALSTFTIACLELPPLPR
jgi:hypothetical protein